ncbi:SulP family inorganic anion transporter [Actinocorallia sp. A-T 12471]|uniref:SulP family inorganic anion transporter n=1 Tax=Actinocorallia sp. A-T 12471 TaxID=3089813 RepID=UPI0029D087D1|nr:SulP family inorganic anion transporter [Actinocorallia sp. A-T 12471]MDX6739770.1 SulP family inorganic anion transporter [Actinocorallia sp. A-T 12471]
MTRFIAPGRDIPASFVVFLVAIPLSLGIAVASGAPVAAGLIAAIVGGIVAGLTGGSPLQVSGPAAGLTVIVASMVQTYGWQATCAITMCAGLLQIGLGACRVARTALAVSPAVVHGMLAGIGVVLVLSQLHIVLGGSPQHSAMANLVELPQQIVRNHSAAVMVGVLTVVVLLAWERLPFRRIPAPLVAVAFATLIAWAGGLDVPRVDLPESLFGGWGLPKAPDAALPDLVGAVVSVALVAGVESLLCAVAVDRMRPVGVPRSDLDRELMGQGAGNFVSGFLGGLPVAGVIVRSTANVRAGALTRASTVLHGVWVLVLALSCAALIEQIPLAALAALLVALGLRMLDRSHLKGLRPHRETWIYWITMAGVVVLGLGEGVLLGIALAACLALRRLTRVRVRTEQRDGRWHVVVAGSLTFLGVPRLNTALAAIPPGVPVDLDLDVDFMDNAAFDTIHTWRVSHERQGGKVDIDEIHESWYENAMTGEAAPKDKSSGGVRWWAPWSRRERGPVQDLDGASPREVLLAGVREYHGRTARLVRPIMAELAMAQTPDHLFITCVDSRVVPNLITASGPGDIFINRNVGNLVPRNGSRVPDDSVMATVEYATSVLDVKTITVCGHSNCGAMAGVLAGGSEVEHLPQLSNWLKHANYSLDRFLHEPEGDHTASPLTRLCQANVVQQLDNLLSYPWLRRRVDLGEIELVGMYLDLATAKVHIYDAESGGFLAVPEEVPAEEDDGRRGAAANA